MFILILVSVPKTEICAIKLNEVTTRAFIYAVKNAYSYQMYIDNLPIIGKN